MSDHYYLHKKEVASTCALRGKKRERARETRARATGVRTKPWIRQSYSQQAHQSRSWNINVKKLTCLIMAVWANFTKSGLDSPSTTSAAVPSLESVSMMATPMTGDAGSSSWSSPPLVDERPGNDKGSTGLDLAEL
ncbi:hypothetical protein PoB_007282000 [Plakobranchus ocellatus]|uniref:Uncharacterized protein n=1 Tax=Plakobranchus ocellatus TaxID=259542 RepID=A0AAV4DQ94_9GAST|nr:hypothetical protein PoB_007282000 [Plakobranchus ocellatus]